MTAPDDKDLPPEMMIGGIAWMIGVMLLLSFNWKFAVGMALIKFGCAMWKGD